jgi:hypothetical protein
MQLEELERRWQQLDQKLDRSLALQTRLAREVVLRPVRRRLHRWGVWPAIDLAFGVGVFLFVGSFVAGHGPDWRLELPAIAVMAGAVGLSADSIRQLKRLSELDWCGPVAGIQSSLERLRADRIRQFKWVMLLSPLVGFCGLMVAIHWLVARLPVDGDRILDRIDPGWVAGNYLFGVLFVPLGYYVARLLAYKGRGQPWWQAVLDGISGNSLKAAARDLEQWASLSSGRTGF